MTELSVLHVLNVLHAPQELLYRGIIGAPKDASALFSVMQMHHFRRYLWPMGAPSYQGQIDLAGNGAIAAELQARQGDVQAKGVALDRPSRWPHAQDDVATCA